MNNLLRIRTLTEKFFDGGTTPEEEQELYDFYRQDDIPEDLRSNCELFRDLVALGSLAPSTVHQDQVRQPGELAALGVEALLPALGQLVQPVGQAAGDDLVHAGEVVGPLHRLDAVAAVFLVGADAHGCISGRSSLPDLDGVDLIPIIRNYREQSTKKQK